MASQIGAWILLEERPSETTMLGLPVQGDSVRIDYDDNTVPSKGTAQRSISDNENARKSYSSPEFGASFCFSPLFGTTI